MDSGVSFSGAIMDVAVTCIRLRQLHKCKNKFDDPICNECDYYIKRYVPCDDTNARLFMVQARQRCNTMYSGTNEHRRWFVAAIIVLVALTIVTYRAEKGTSPKVKPQAVSVEASTSVVELQQTAPPVNIYNVLWKVARDLDNGIDVNQDRKTNCIDAAIAFYRHYPYKEDVQVWESVDPEFRHLFNRVRQGNQWLLIEPQACWKDLGRGYMVENYWQRTLRSQYIFDATRGWSYFY